MNDDVQWFGLGGLFLIRVGEMGCLAILASLPVLSIISLVAVAIGGR